ncbi:MAG: translocation/assembly module TamB domain-containing protein [Desulfuromonadales bacterium]|nr:translocation/assembly module TamB domain-containing protein [Desulfuromonadales bacterium]MBN2792108.1 translocation/assembly module TamB domain-containing protein [Desulfuromonadales bacterium]
MKTWLTGIILAILLFLAGCAGGSWLLYSDAGASWALPRLAESQGGHIGQIEGSLIGRLRLTDVTFDHSKAVISAQRIELQTRINIYPPRLTVTGLTVSHLAIDNRSTTSSNRAPGFSWPQLPGWLQLIEVDLQQVDFYTIHVRSEASETLHIDQFHGRMHWREQSLRLADLQLTSPRFALAGNLSAGFTSPALTGELVVTNRQKEHQFWQQIVVSGNLAQKNSQSLKGPCRIQLDDLQGPWLTVEGNIGLSNENIQFEQLRLTSSRRTGLIQADGNFSFVAAKPGLSSRLRLEDLQLDTELGRPVKLSGDIDITGTPDGYRGHFSLTDRVVEPLVVTLSGQFSGNLQQLLLTDLQGQALDGTVTGKLSAAWQPHLQIRTKLVGRDLNVRKLHQQLEGSLNGTLDAELSKTAEGLTGQMNLTLDNSLLHGQQLRGHTRMIFNPEQVEIAEVNLTGSGFTLNGQGALNEKLRLSWQVDNLEQLLSDWSGQLNGSGWLQISPEGISADVSSRGQKLQFGTTLLNSWKLEGKLSNSRQWQIALSGEGLKTPHPGAAVERFQLTSAGDLAKHQVDLTLEQPTRSWLGHFTGGWNGEQWQGYLERFLLSDAQLGQWQAEQPATLLLSREFLQLGHLPLVSQSRETLVLQGSYRLPDQQGEGQIEWSALNLNRFGPWLSDLELSGTSSGHLSVKMLDSPELLGQVKLQGQLISQYLSFELLNGNGQIAWNERGLNSKLTLKLADASQVDIRLSSDEPFAASPPKKLFFTARGENFSLQRALSWLPPELNLTGKLSLTASGTWLANQVGQLSGRAAIADGQLFWQEDEDLVRADIKRGDLSWEWREQFSGQVELELEERGNIDANLTFPVPASWPLQADNQLPLSGNLTARLQELGILSILFPKQVQDSSGQLKVDLQLGGFWQEPRIEGKAHLFDARAFLPQPGIQLNNIEIDTHSDGRQLIIDRLQAQSGDGSLTGQGKVELERWRPQKYHLELTGKNFQALNLPELQVQLSPAVTIDGDLQSYRLSGDVTVPRLLFSGRKNTGLAQRSQDVVVIDAPETVQKQRRLKPEIDLQLHLGEQVLVKSTGLDARLEGDLRLGSTPRGALAAYGDIRVTKGRYASYGVNLDITRGDLFFNGGPIEQPVMDILALRTVGEIRAGVKVTGTPKQPVVQLYSEPGMAETDILSYIVLGRPIGAERSQQDMLMTAAGALLSQGESVVLQEKLKNTLGLDVLDINAGNGDVGSSVITTGKYLSPDLYISLGYSLFDNSNEVKLRYNLSPRWEIESSIGSESGVDLFYKIDIP